MDQNVMYIRQTSVGPFPCLTVNFNPAFLWLVFKDTGFPFIRWN